MSLLQVKERLSKKQVHSLESLSRELRTNKEEVKKAIDILLRYGFLEDVEIISNNELFVKNCSRSVKSKCSSCKVSFCLLKSKIE